MNKVVIGGNSMKRTIYLVIIAAFLLVSACKPKTPTPTPEPVPSATLPALVPTNTSLPETAALPTETAPSATNTPAPAGPSTPVDYSSAVYLDDRSNPAAMLYSLANAFNRHEYIRAYSYWSNPMDYLGILDAFSNTYANVSSVQLTLGDIYSEGAAGSIYYSAPSVFTFTHSDNTAEKASACFLMRLPQPANFGEPPIELLKISKGGFTPVAAGISDSDALTSACYGTDYSTAAAGNPPLSHDLEPLSELGPDNYIDNRSGAVEVVSSLFNAINRKEYVRAFSYWQDPAAVGNYADYAAGFANTGLIHVTFGTVVSDAGAGQYYYSIPVAQTVENTDGTTQIFVGCYTLHLANPGMQAVMPFEPLGIVKGKNALVANDVGIEPLMERVCN